MGLRTFCLTLICLCALSAAGLQSLTAKGATVPEIAAVGRADVAANVRAQRSGDAALGTLQQDVEIYLPLTTKDGTVTATTTVTPTVSPSPSPSASPSPSPSPSPSVSPTPSLTPIVADLFVDDSNTSGTQNGSAQKPYASVQAAIDASSGDQTTIAVAAGVYAENVRIENKAVHLFGGFVGGTVADYTSGDGGDFGDRDPLTNISHLQGDKTDSVVTMLEPFSSTVDGFRITDGTRSLGPEFAQVGGGFYISGGAPTIAHNLIENNDTRPLGLEEKEPVGGGIFSQDADIAILNNTIQNNISGRGAGIAIIGGIVTIRGNTVRNNSGFSINNGNHGGGLYITSPHAEISHNLIIGNEIGRAFESPYGWGGGIIIFGDSANPSQVSFAHLSYNIITENYAPSVGGGVFIDDGASAVLDHELIYNNDCPDGGTRGGVGIYVDGYRDSENEIGSKVTIDHTTVAGHDCETQGGNGLYVEVNSGVTVTNSIFWGNAGDDFLVVDDTAAITVTYTLAEEAIAGVGNLSVDPLFANAAQFDFHLKSTAGRWDAKANGGNGAFVLDASDSPAIDAGDPASPFAAEVAPNGGRANLGAYGNTAEASRSRP